MRQQEEGKRKQGEAPIQGRDGLLYSSLRFPPDRGEHAGLFAPEDVKSSRNQTKPDDEGKR